jgi:hypothetical protein
MPYGDLTEHRVVYLGPWPKRAEMYERAGELYDALDRTEEAKVGTERCGHLTKQKYTVMVT